MVTQRAEVLPAHPTPPISHRQAEEAMTAKFQPIVKAMANSIKRSLPEHVELDDLISAANIGLLFAIRNYSPAKGVPLQNWIKFRIRGAMVDFLRSEDSASRQTRREVKALEEVTRKLSNELLRYPTAEEIAAAGVSIKKQTETRTNAPHILSLTRNATKDQDPYSEFEHQLVDPAESPVETITRREVQAKLAQAILKLPQRWQDALSLHFQGLSNEEIGKVMGFNYTRASQLINQSIKRLRTIMQEAAK